MRLIMKNILIHGLGQNDKSWNIVKEELEKFNIEVETPNLFDITKTNLLNYDNMYQELVNYLNGFDEKVNLVGLSLGGILAIDYANNFKDKVNSLILIGTPYKIPKALFTIQIIVYKFMPKKIFKKIGCSKKNIIELLNSMKSLNVEKNAPNIKCDTLILCGEKEKNNINMKSAKKLNEVIKNSKFKVIKNAGHEVNIDNPKELALTIYDFFNNYNK